MAAADFLDEDNPCGVALLNLVASGSSVVAELNRLAAATPDAFVPGSAANTRYAALMFEINYLSNSEMYEQRINADPHTSEVSEEFGESYGEVVARFYTLFESVVQYHADLLKFLTDLKQGFYIQHTLEDVLLNVDGRQLMCEAFYLLGVILLLLDVRIPGPMREALIVSHVRIAGEGATQELESVARVCKSSGYLPTSPPRRPASYPEAYFERLPVPAALVDMLLDRLRSDDVYGLTRVFSTPTLRATALSRQASMLYVILFFSPATLHKNKSAMREVVDKHFSDNWVLPLYMGHLVDLSVEWQPYKAASEALNSEPLDLRNVAANAERWHGVLATASAALDEYRREGILTDQFVIDHQSELLACLRDANAALRWLLLQSRSGHKKAAALLAKKFPIDLGAMLQVIMRTAQLEHKLREQLGQLLEEKPQRWEEARTAGVQMLQDLSAFFGGQVALSRVAADDDLRDYFGGLAAKVESLDIGRARVAGRTIQGIINGLEEIESFEVIDTSTQVKEYLGATREQLVAMVRVVNLSDGVLQDLDDIANMAWAWGLKAALVPYMQAHMRAQPSSMHLLRALFIKLASVLDVPIQRIMEADSPDALSVAQFYSSSLVAYVRQVLTAIPAAVFELLREINAKMASDIGVIPSKLEATQLKQYASVGARYEVSLRTHRISVFTEGVMSMKETLLGVIEMDPRQLLHEGIYKYLIDQVTRALDGGLAFDLRRGRGRDPVRAVSSQLSSLASGLNTFRRSFEYVQDYVDLYGLKVWQTQLTRVLAFYTEQECNRFLKKKILPAASVHQSSETPIELRLDKEGTTFIGRLGAALLELSTPAHAHYSPLAHSWVDAEGNEVMGMTFFGLLQQALGVQGLLSADRLLSFNVGHTLGRIFGAFKESSNAGATEKLRGIVAALGPPQHVSPAGSKGFLSALKNFRSLSGLCDSLVTIGRCQLTRSHLQDQLLFACRLDSNLLFNALRTMNSAVLLDVRRHYADPEKHPYPSMHSHLLPELTRHAEAAGLGDPLSKIYSTATALPWFGMYLGCVVLYALPLMQYDGELATLVPARRAKTPIDGMAFAVGVGTVLRQLHPAVTKQALAFLGHFVRSSLYESFNTSKPSCPEDIPKLLWLVLQLQARAAIPLAVLHEYFPPHILSTLNVE